MAQVRSWAGLDVHARGVLAVTVDAASGEMRNRRLPGTTAEVVEFCGSLPGPTRVAYEAGPTGYALAKASKYAAERAVWGVPIGAHQGVAHPLAEAKIELELARLMGAKAAALYDAGLDAGEAANIAKVAAAEAAVHCVDQAIQAHGGNGFALE